MSDPDPLARNLDTQHRRLADIEQHLDALLAGQTPDEVPAAPDRPETYAVLTATNDTLRSGRGWDTIDLDAAFTSEALADFELWRRRRRVPWQIDDVVAVAAAGAIGIAATWFDTTIDRIVRDRLAVFSESSLIRRWERDAKRMPIDHMGGGFGGKLHRVRSAGHDIGRPFEALRQIRAGEFHGYAWDHGVRTEVFRDNYRGHRYEPVGSQAEALVLWGKHLLADLVTETSLPPPGWTKLYELDNKQLRKFAHDAYGSGVNLRSLTVGALPVLSTEITIRTHVHGRSMTTRGTAVLEAGQSALRDELLLAGHALVGAASLGGSVTASLAATPAAGFRHINWPVLLKVATASLSVARNARARRTTAPSWDGLLADLAAPWQLDEATALDQVCSARQNEH